MNANLSWRNFMALKMYEKMGVTNICISYMHYIYKNSKSFHRYAANLPIEH